MSDLPLHRLDKIRNEVVAPLQLDIDVRPRPVAVSLRRTSELYMKTATITIAPTTNSSTMTFLPPGVVFWCTGSSTILSPAGTSWQKSRSSGCAPGTQSGPSFFNVWLFHLYPPTRPIYLRPLNS